MIDPDYRLNVNFPRCEICDHPLQKDEVGTLFCEECEEWEDMYPQYEERIVY